MLQEQLVALERENAFLKGIVKEDRKQMRKLEQELQTLKLAAQASETCFEVASVFQLETDLLQKKISELNGELSAQMQSLQNEKLHEKILKAKIKNLEAEIEEKNVLLSGCQQRTLLENELRRKLATLKPCFDSLKEAERLLVNCLEEIHELGQRTGEELFVSATLAKSYIRAKVKATERAGLTREALRDCLASRYEIELSLCHSLKKQVEALREYFEEKIKALEEANGEVYQKWQTKMDIHISLSSHCDVLQGKIISVVGENAKLCEHLEAMEDVSLETVQSEGELVGECMREILCADMEFI